MSGEYEAMKAIIDIRAERDRLQAQVAQMREALVTAKRSFAIHRDCTFDGACHLDCGYYVKESGGNTCFAICDDAERLTDAALQSTGEDYHNPADLEHIRVLEIDLAESRKEAEAYKEYERLAVLMR